MKTYPWLVASLLFWWCSLALAQGINATIDRRQTTVDQPLVLTVTVEGSQNAQPSLPDLSAFQVSSRGQSSQISIINGAQTVSIAYNFILFPRSPGTFTIGPAQVSLGGKTYSSKPFSVTVKPAGEAVVEEQGIFITGKVSKTDPVVGEPIVYTFRFYRRVDARNASLELPDFDGFVVEDLGEQRDFDANVKGQQYRVTEFKKALTPQEVGELTIPSAVLQVDVITRSRRQRRSLFDDFFSGGGTAQRKLLRSGDVKVTVGELPRAPKGFSGLVGEFTLKAALSRTELKVGESTTLTATVAGTGNVRAIPEPDMGSLEQFKVYADKPKGSVDTKGKALRGRRTFTTALVPLAAGSQQVGPVQIVIFDTKLGKYRTLRKGPFTLEVAPGDGEEDLMLTEGLGAGGGKVAVRVVGDDILPIYRRLDALDEGADLRRGVVTTGMVAPPLLYLGLLGWVRRRDRYASDSGLRRRQAASKVASKLLKDVEAAVASDDATEAARAASKALRGFIGDKLGAEGGALTPTEAETRLQAACGDEALAARVRKTLEGLEAAQYGGGLPIDSERGLGGLVDEMRGLITEVDKALRGRR